MNIIKKIYYIIDSVEKFLVIISVGIALIVYTTNVFSRYFFSFPLGWPDELSRYLLILSVYMGSCLAIKKRAHISVKILELNSPFFKGLQYIIVTTAGIIFSIVIIIYGIEFVSALIDSGQIAITLKIPAYIVYLILPIGGILFLISLILDFLQHYDIIKL